MPPDIDTDDEARLRLLSPTSTPTVAHRYIDADNKAAFQALQREIEAGQRWAIAGPAEIRGSETKIPLIDLGRIDSLSVSAGSGFRQRFQG